MPEQLARVLSAGASGVGGVVAGAAGLVRHAAAATVRDTAHTARRLTVHVGGRHFHSDAVVDKLPPDCRPPQARHLANAIKDFEEADASWAQARDALEQLATAQEALARAACALGDLFERRGASAGGATGACLGGAGEATAVVGAAHRRAAGALREHAIRPGVAHASIAMDDAAKTLEEYRKVRALEGIAALRVKRLRNQGYGGANAPAGRGAVALRHAEETRAARSGETNALGSKLEAKLRLLSCSGQELMLQQVAFYLRAELSCYESSAGALRGAQGAIQPALDEVRLVATLELANPGSEINAWAVVPPATQGKEPVTVTKCAETQGGQGASAVDLRFVTVGLNADKTNGHVAVAMAVVTTRGPQLERPMLTGLDTPSPMPSAMP